MDSHILEILDTGREKSCKYNTPSTCSIRYESLCSGEQSGHSQGIALETCKNLFALPSHAQCASLAPLPLTALCKKRVECAGKCTLLPCQPHWPQPSQATKAIKPQASCTASLHEHDYNPACSLQSFFT
jgi:hypothetical protein